MENQLVKIVNESGLDQTKGQILLTNFQNYFEIAAEWEAKINALNVTDVSQVAEMKMAREARLFLARKRIDVESTRKQLGENALREKQTIDSIAKILKNLIEPLEEKAEQIEKFKEIKEEREMAERLQQRIEILMPYNVAIDSNYLRLMPEDQFKTYLTGLETEKKRKIAEEIQAEKERIERERILNLHNQRKELLLPYWNFISSDLQLTNFGNIPGFDFDNILTQAKLSKKQQEEKQEKIRKENERLQKENEAKEKQLLAERKEAELKAQKEREEAQAKLYAEKEAARKQAEKARIEREELENKLRIQQEKELTEKRQAELKAENERKEAEKASKAPDKEKLKVWVDSAKINEIPAVKGELNAIAIEIEKKFEAFKIWAKSQINNI